VKASAGFVVSGLMLVALAACAPTYSPAPVDYRGARGAAPPQAPVVAGRTEQSPQPSQQQSAQQQAPRPGQASEQTVFEPAQAPARPVDQTFARPVQGVVAAPLGPIEADGARMPEPGVAVVPLDRFVIDGPVAGALQQTGSVEVVAGDTLFTLSRRYAVPMRALIETNRLEPPFDLRVGQMLALPPPQIHIVEAGETVYSIGKRFNVDPRSLALMNGLPKPYLVRPGDPVRLPSLARDTQTRQEGAPTIDDGRPIDLTAEAPDGAFGAPAPRPARLPMPETASVPLVTPPGAPSGGPIATASGTGAFLWPVRGTLLRGYGVTGTGQRNDGINIGAERGTPIRAAAAGQVAYAGNQLAAFGNLILVRHPTGYITAYAHVDQLSVKEGDTVAAGQQIATVGTSGAVETPQLHFQIRKGKSVVDPMTLLGKSQG